MSFIRQITAPSLLLFLLVANHTTAFAGCTEYQHSPDTEIEQYVSILEDPEKPEIKRSIAYDKVACSDNSIYRQYALKIGLQDTSGSILRSKILMAAMMAKDNFVIDLIGSPNLTKDSKAYIKENNGQIRFKAYNRDPVEGGA